MKAIPLLLALITAPAGAQVGFSAEDLAVAAREVTGATAPDAAATLSVAARSERIRAVLAVTMDEAPSHLTSEELRVLTTAMGPPGEDRDLLLSYLTRAGSVAIGGPDLSGIYNPFCDGWLLLRWSHVGGAPRLKGAVLATGNAMRGGIAASSAGDDIPFAQALAMRRVHMLGALAGLDAEYVFRQHAAAREVQTSDVLASARLQVGALARWSRANPALLARLEHRIRRADETALLAFPQRVRDAVSPVAVVSTPTGAELVLASPIYPNRTLFAEFSGDGEPELFALDLDPANGGFVQ